MKILNILNSDGSLYWKETFNTQDDLDSWLNEEKTRPYWNSDFMCKIEEIKNYDHEKFAIASFKEKRNSLLAQTDFMMLPDAPQYIKDKMADIIAYRQALRDLPKNTDYKNPIFPKNPLE